MVTALVFFGMAGFFGIAALMVTLTRRRNVSDAVAVIDPPTQRNFEIYKKETTYPERPGPPSHKVNAYRGGIALIILGAVFLLALLGSRPEAAMLSPFAVIGGYWLIKVGMNADARERQNVEERAQAREADTRYEKADIEFETSRAAAKRTAVLNHKQDEVTLTALEADRFAQEQRKRDIEQKEVLRPASQRYGVSIDQLQEINAQKLRNDVEAQKEWEKTRQELRAGDLLTLEDNQRVNELFEDLDVYRTRLETAERKTYASRENKTRAIKIIEDQIETLEDQIRGFQTRLREAKDWQKLEAKTRSQANKRADYPPEVDEDPDEV